jgi:hypothetical protein
VFQYKQITGPSCNESAIMINVSPDSWLITSGNGTISELSVSFFYWDLRKSKVAIIQSALASGGQFC